MKPVVKTSIIVGSIVLLITIGIVVVSFLSIRQYHDRNSWAEFEITGDGIPDGVRNYKSTPNTNVMELQGVKSYGKGETIDLDFATFTVERVDIGKTERVHIFSEDELVYNGEVTHKAVLEKEDGCEIHTQGKKATIMLTEIGYR